jgi:hypothetical protein
MRPSILVVVLLVLPACFSGCPSRVTMAPRSVQVLDAEHGLPVAGVPVEYAVRYELSRGKLLGVVPAPEPTLGYRLEVLPGVVTDAAGVVEIAAREIRLRGNETISSEVLLINTRVAAGRHGVVRLKEILSSSCQTLRVIDCWPPSDVGAAIWAAPFESERRELLEPVNPQYSGVAVFVRASPAEPDPDTGSPSRVDAVDHVTTRAGPEKIVVRLRRLGPTVPGPTK